MTEPKPPVFNVPRILKVFGKLKTEMAIYQGRTLIGDEFKDFLNNVYLTLGFKGPFQSCYESLSHLAGIRLTKDICREVTWRLAGNLDVLKAGNAVMPWGAQTELEWVPVQILSVYPGTRTKNLVKGETRNTPGAQLNMIVLGGSPAGKVITRFYPSTYLLSGRVKVNFGFEKYDKAIFRRDTSPRKSYPLRDLLEYTRARFYGMVDPELSQHGPMFEKIKCGPGFLKHNRSLAQRRQRTDYVCPMAYDVQTKPCYLCEKGYSGPNSCEIACHPVDYAVQECVKCKQKDQYIDLQRSNDMCVACKNRIPLL